MPIMELQEFRRDFFETSRATYAFPLLTLDQTLEDGLVHYNNQKPRPIEMFPDDEQNPETYKSKGYEYMLPMKAKDYIRERHESWWKDPTVAAQLKHDGIRVTMHVRRGVNRIFTGRPVKNGWTGEKTDRLPHLRDYQIGHLRGTVFDGEIISPNGVSLEDFKYAAGVLNSKPAKAIQTQLQKGILLFVVFDIIYYQGFYVGNTPYAFRYWLIQKLLRHENGRLRNPFMIPCFTVFDTVEIDGKTYDKRAFFELMKERDVEGLILRQNKLPYQFDHKSSYMLKLKEVVTVDLIIIGFTEANEGKTGQFKGLIGAFELGCFIPKKVYEKNKKIYKSVETTYTHIDGRKLKLPELKDHVLVYFGKSSGITVDLRKDMTANPDKYVGEVVKVKCNKVFEDSLAPRNPRFVALHESKVAKHVTFDAYKESIEVLQSGGTN
jgi:ATP-dependent DNA ligase